VDEVVVTDNTDEAAPVTDGLLKLVVAPTGKPLTARLIFPLKPLEARAATE
jgi:hypothetical protein